MKILSCFIEIQSILSLNTLENNLTSILQIYVTLYTINLDLVFTKQLIKKVQSIVSQVLNEEFHLHWWGIHSGKSVSALHSVAPCLCYFCILPLFYLCYFKLLLKLLFMWKHLISCRPVCIMMWKKKVWFLGADHDSSQLKNKKFYGILIHLISAMFDIFLRKIII